MEILNKAKNVFDVAATKTEEFIYDQKCNIKMARVCADIKKQYERLGRLCYRKIGGLKIDENEFDAVVEKITVLKTELNALRDGTVEEPEFESIVFEDGEPVSNNGEEE